MIAHTSLGSPGHSKAFPNFPQGVSIKSNQRGECPNFAEGYYIYEHHGHRKSRNNAGHDLYGELEPKPMRQSPVECQNTDFDQEYRDEVLDVVRVPALSPADGLSWLLFSLPIRGNWSVFEVENLMLSGAGWVYT